MYCVSIRCGKGSVGIAAAFIVIFLLANTIDVSAQYQARKPGAAAAQASIQVTSPTGTETWEKGNRYDITWTSTGISGGSVKVEFIDGNGKATPLVRQTQNNGKCSISLNFSVADGDYRIKVSTTDGKTTGESSGTIHVGKPTGSSATAKSTTTPSVTQPKTYAPRTPTGTTNTAPAVTNTTSPVSVTGQTVAVSQDVVRIDFPTVEVPAVELQMADLPSISETSAIQPRAPQMRILPSMIDVTAPVADVAWQADSRYTINWTSNDLDGPVKIDLINAQRGTDGIVSHFHIPVVASTENDGTYEYLVPERFGYHSTYYVCEVSSLDGKTKDQSPQYFDVYTEPVDLTCWIMDLEQKQVNIWYIVYSKDEMWLEFDVWIRNNGTRRQIDSVLVDVVLIKEPEEIVVAQEEWGLSSINAQLWYSTPEPRKFDISSKWNAFLTRGGREVNLESGAYRVEIMVDPDNSLGENPALRDNNKHVQRFEIQ